MTISNSSLRDTGIEFRDRSGLPDHQRTRVSMVGCTFNHNGAMDLLTNGVANKQIVLSTSASVQMHDSFSARVIPGPGTVTVESDLTGLKR